MHAELAGFQSALAAEDWPLALRHCSRLLKTSPRHVSLLYNKGLILKKMQRFREADECLSNVLRYEPRHDKARFELAGSALDTGRLDVAAAHYLEYLVSCPDDSDAHLNLGKALLRLNRAAEARAHLQRAYDLNNSAYTAQCLATAMRDCGEMDDCERLLASLDNSSPEVAAMRLKILTQGAVGRLSLATNRYLGAL